MFVDLDWPLNASSLLSASAELLVHYQQYPRDLGSSTDLWKGGILPNKPLDKIQFTLEAISCLKTRDGVRKIKSFPLERRTTSMTNRRAYSSVLKILAVISRVNNSLTRSVLPDLSLLFDDLHRLSNFAFLERMT